jgi:hypothetical protein
LKAPFLGWQRGERQLCKTVSVSTFAEEDAKPPHHERETLVGEQTTIISHVQSALTRLGIRNFNPTLKKAPERLEPVRTPEGQSIPVQQARRIAALWSASTSSMSRHNEGRGLVHDLSPLEWYRARALRRVVAAQSKTIQ